MGMGSLKDLQVSMEKANDWELFDVVSDCSLMYQQGGNLKAIKGYLDMAIHYFGENAVLDAIEKWGFKELKPFIKSSKPKMKQRTINIILLAKGYYPDKNYDTYSRRKALYEYMASIYGKKEYPYDYDALLKEVKIAVLDYLKVSSFPSQLIEDYFFALENGSDELEAWFIAMAEIPMADKVEREWKYINGFDAESAAYVRKEDTGEKMYPDWRN